MVIENSKKDVQLTIETALWKEITENFMFHAHSMCLFLNIFKKEQRPLHELQITIDTVSDLMKDKQDEKTREMGTKRKKIMKEKEFTPKKIKTVKFIKVSPKAYDILDKYDCTVCDKKFVFLKSLKRHVKENHEGIPISGTLKEKQDLVTCRMCKNKRVPRDQIQRHLKIIHKVAKVEHENKKTNLRGWFTLDDVQWLPLWMGLSEEDPEEEMTVPVKGNVVELFGVQYEVDNDGVEEKNEDSSHTMKKIKIDSQSGSSNKKKNFNADPDTSSVKEIGHGEAVGFVQDAFVKDDSYEETSPNRIPGMSHKRKLFGSPSEEDFRPMLTVSEEDVLTENTERVDEDVLGEGIEIGLLLPQASNEKLTMKTNESENIKLKVFLEKEKIADFWHMGVIDEDLDSDYEQGDSESFTEARVQMKMLRLV